MEDAKRRKEILFASRTDPPWHATEQRRPKRILRRKTAQTGRGSMPQVAMCTRGSLYKMVATRPRATVLGKIALQKIARNGEPPTARKLKTKQDYTTSYSTLEDSCELKIHNMHPLPYLLSLHPVPNRGSWMEAEKSDSSDSNYTVSFPTPCA